MKLCQNCLRKGHVTRRCRLPGVCRVPGCRKVHNSLLHAALNKKEDENTSAESAVMTTAVSTSELMLCTAEVILVNPDDPKKSITVRAMLDNASQSMLVSERVVQALRLPSQPSCTRLVGVGETPCKLIPDRCAVKIQSKHNSFSITMSCLVLPSISGKLPKNSYSVEHFNLSDYLLADPNFNKSNTVDMLIGVELFWDLIIFEKRSLGPNYPVLINSKLGWLVAPPSIVDGKSFSSPEESYCNFTRNDDVINLHNDMAKFWELEKVPDKAILSEEEKECEQHFVSNTTRTEDGRFCVKLPLRDDRDCLGNSYRLAEKRFLNLESRFRRQPLLKELYFDFIDEYARLGHLSIYDTPSSNTKYR
ncbi:putative peptidase (DUF1758) domain-containing protein [Phthorimaea operculella]|nr:putative peptidase (DUF1758) domain-containing protein [Phthorimaea operculella]